jgi:hypothetical protein
MTPAPAGIDGATLHFGKSTLKLADLPKTIAGRTNVIVGICAETFARGIPLSVLPTLVEHTGSDAYVNFRPGETPVTTRLSDRGPIQKGRIRRDVDVTTLRHFDQPTGLRVA